MLAGCHRAGPETLWDEAVPAANRGTWNARLFPAEAATDGCRRWLWMLDPAAASHEQFHQWLSTDRYSMEQMAALCDQEAFHRRRGVFRGRRIFSSLKLCFRPDSGFSAADLAHLLVEAPDPARCFSEVLAEARRHWERPIAAAEGAFVFSRIIHSLGSAVLVWAEDPGAPLAWLLRRSDATEGGLAPFSSGGLSQFSFDERGLSQFSFDERGLSQFSFDERGLSQFSFDENGTVPLPGALPDEAAVSVGQWAERARALAFEFLRRRIVASGEPVCPRPVNALRSDEIVWGRAPARIDLTGGWTDTPPFALEHGGCVLNAAVELNGQPPIQVHARVTPERLIRCRSIDVGSQVESAAGTTCSTMPSRRRTFRSSRRPWPRPASRPRPRAWPPARRSKNSCERFGGGLEVTTLAAIPKGSGLGTSSIMGAVLTAVIHRVVGRSLTPDALFHAVLRLEQALTTGGGWQDQIGGCC